MSWALCLSVCPIIEQLLCDHRIDFEKDCDAKIGSIFEHKDMFKT